jgi:hypothetical protein
MWYETALQSAQSAPTTSSSPHHIESPRRWPGDSYPFNFPREGEADPGLISSLHRQHAVQLTPARPAGACRQR